MATQGSLIRAVNYNAIQEVVAKILGSGQGNFGYGQTVTSSQVLPNPSNTTGRQIIEANDWAKLKIDILKIANHAGIAGNPLITSIPNITRGLEIDDSQVNAFEGCLTFLSNNRFLLAESSDESLNIDQSRTTAWGNSSVPTVRHSFTIDFGSANNARYFFNSGSQIRFSAARSGGTGTQQNTSWTNLLSSMGTVAYNVNGTTASSGTTSLIGFYSLKNVPQTVFTKTGTSQYAGNDYTITMSCDVANNSNGTARYIYVAVYFNDDHVNAFADSVTGTLTHNVIVRRASGNNVNVAKPTATNTILLTA